jgi:hypothetical protein
MKPEQFLAALVHVHGTFAAPKPAPLFIVAVEVLSGHIESGMCAHIPLNSSFSVPVRILAVAHVNNDLGVKLLGLVLDCDNDELGRELIESLHVGEETWDISSDG